VILTYSDVYNKEVPVYLSKLKELDFFTKEDLNWRLKPTEVIDNFCKKRFDILIDLTMEKCNPLEHIMASSQAALKVCRKGAQNQNYADLIVDIAVEKSEKEFLVHMKEMLSKFSFN